MRGQRELFEQTYVTVHSWLVRRTLAYQQLFARVAALVQRHGTAQLPRRPAALVPSSTGEVLAPLAAAADVWHCLDVNPLCLARCAQRLPTVQTHAVDLDREWPLAPEQLGLVVSIHALHYVRRPEELLQQVARSLAPGGLSIWVVFRGTDGRPAGLVTTMRRLWQEVGVAALANFLPWLAMDALMLGTSPGDRHFWDEAGLRRLLEGAGLQLLQLEPTFHGCSLLAVARKPGGAP
jgi:SAM-dependent methyltransferase